MGFVNSKSASEHIAEWAIRRGALGEAIPGEYLKTMSFHLSPVTLFLTPSLPPLISLFLSPSWF